jgi:hypothetical protein
MPLAVRVNSIAADVKLRVTDIVKEAPTANVAGTPEHENTSRLVLQPFRVRACWPPVHFTLMVLVSPATTEPKLAVPQVIRGFCDTPIPYI